MENIKYGKMPTKATPSAILLDKIYSALKCRLETWKLLIQDQNTNFMGSAGTTIIIHGNKEPTV